MTEADLWRKDREKAWLAVLLAWVAGFVDAVGLPVALTLVPRAYERQQRGNGGVFRAGTLGRRVPSRVPDPNVCSGRRCRGGAERSRVPTRRPFALFIRPSFLRL
jgi:hypothetical protein